MTETIKPSLATGAPLTPDTWADFVTRLTHHCRGEGVNEHCTANAIFIVQARRWVYGIDIDYDPELVVLCEDEKWDSPQDYWADAHEELQAQLDAAANAEFNEAFMSCERHSQWSLLGALENHQVVGRQERWDYVSANFTKEAAEAFIKRKGHDYPDGMRIDVDAQLYAWEFEVIKNAIMDGRLVLKEEGAA